MTMNNPHGYFFKSKYLIALYSLDDYPLAIFDNPNDWSRQEHKNLSSIQSILSCHLRGKWTHIMYRGIKCKLHLIELDSDDIESILKREEVDYDQKHIAAVFR